MAMAEKNVAEGTAVLTQGEENDHFYVVQSGSFTVFKCEEGRQPSLENPGASLGLQLQCCRRHGGSQAGWRVRQPPHVVAACQLSSLAIDAAVPHECLNW